MAPSSRLRRTYRPGSPFLPSSASPIPPSRKPGNGSVPAIRNSGFTFPMKRIVVNLAPADLKKGGPAYDLPIALSIILASEQVVADVTRMVFIGELSLDGALRHTNGVLPMVALAYQHGFSTVVVPEADAREASLVKGATILPFSSLAQLVSYLRNEIPAPECHAGRNQRFYPDPCGRYRPGLRQGPGARQARPRGGRGGGAQHGHGRSAGERQDAAGPGPTLDTAAADR